MPHALIYQTAFVQSGQPATVSEATPYAPGQLGREISVLIPNDGTSTTQGMTKVYKYVQMDSAATVANYPGAALYWSGALGRQTFLVTTNDTNLGQAAGMSPLGNPTAGQYGWIQVGGPCMGKLISSPTATPSAAGMFIIPTATNGKVDCLAAGTAATYREFGVTSPNFTATWQPTASMVEVILNLENCNNP